MPPKTKKTKLSPEAPKEEPPTINYGIFFLHFEDPKLTNIAKQFIQELQKRSRRAVVGFSYDDIAIDILKMQEDAIASGVQEKSVTPKSGKKDKSSPEGKKDKSASPEGKGDKSPKPESKKDKNVPSEGKKDKGKQTASEGKKDKDKKMGKEPPEEKNAQTQVVLMEPPELKKIEPQMFVLDENNFGQFLAKINEKIEEYVTVSSILQNVVKTRKEFDLLQYWLDTEVKSPQKGKGKKGDDKSVGSKKSARTRGGAEKKPKNEKTKKGKKEDEDAIPCKIKAVSYVKLDEKVFSNFQPRIHDVSVKVKYIEDHPLYGVDVYIVIIGNFKKEVFLELVRRGLPLRGISYFLTEQTRPINDFEVTGGILKAIHDVRKENELRNVGISVYYVDPLSECRATVLRKEIYDQLSFHLYDLETSRRQYENYLAHLYLSDVSEKQPCPSSPVSILKESDLPLNALDDITIPIYLDALFDIVHENLFLDSSSHLEGEEEEENISDDEDDEDPFIISPCGTPLIEHADVLLQNTLASEIDVSHYQKAIHVYKKASNLDKIFKLYSHSKVAVEGDLSHADLYYSTEKCLPVYHFTEPLSKGSLLQKFIVAFYNSDYIEFFYVATKGHVFASFLQSPYNFTEKSKKSTLRTKVCFRDYLKYVAPYIEDWIQDQEHLYDVKTAFEKVQREFTVPNPSLSRRDFYRKSSIKENIELQKEMPPPELKEEDAKAEKKTKSSAKDAKGAKGAKDAKDAKDSKDAKDAKGAKDAKDAKDSKDAKDPKGAKGAKDAKGAKGTKNVKDTKDVKGEKDDKVAKDIKDKGALEMDIIKDEKKFAGYMLGEDVIELNTFNAIYKSETTMLRLNRDIWIFGPKIFGLELLYGGNRIFFNKIYPNNHHIAKLRIQTHNSITIAFDHMPMLSPKEEGKEENYLNETENEVAKISDKWNISYPHVTMTWPSLLKVQTIYDPETEQLIEVRQYSWRKSIAEKQRFMFCDGSVLIFYLNRTIRLLTANGTIYESGALLDGNLEDELDMPEVQEGFAQMMHKFQNELDYIKRYHEHLDTENYILTTAEGYNFRVRSGQIVEENHKFLTLEWFDYAKGERCSSREDGVKTITSKRDLVCYYPDGTVIRSSLEDQLLYRYISREDGSESFIVLPERLDGHTVSAVAVTTSIIKELINIASDELCVFTSSSHLIQHECYATVHFIKEEKVDIHSPGSVNLSFAGKEVNFDLGGELSLRCSEDECIICVHKTAGKNDVGYDEDSQLHRLNGSINFKQDELPLLVLTERDEIVTVFENFTWEMFSKTKRNTYAQFAEHNYSDMIFDQYTEGFQLHAENDITLIRSKATMQKSSIIAKDEDILVVLQSFKKFDDIFRLPIGDLGEFLKKFKVPDFECEIKKTVKKDKVDLCERMEDLMTVRVLENAEIPVEAKLRRTSSGTIIPTIEDIMERKRKKLQRLKVYQAMLRKKVFPKYWEFMEAGGHIKYFNVCKFTKQLEMEPIPSDDCFTQDLMGEEYVPSSNVSSHSAIPEFIGSSKSSFIRSWDNLQEKNEVDVEKLEEIEDEALWEDDFVCDCPSTSTSEEKSCHCPSSLILVKPPCACTNVEKGTCGCYAVNKIERFTPN